MVGVEVKERIPDSVLREADEVVNIDLTAEELVERLKAGKIYAKEKIQTALDNFFNPTNILQLRELALREVAFRVGKKVDDEVKHGHHPPGHATPSDESSANGGGAGRKGSQSGL